MAIGMGVSQKMQSVKPMKTMDLMTDLVQEQDKIDKRLKSWTALVGESRASDAFNLLKTGAKNESGQHSVTLPELLTEVWLRQHNINYIVQVDLGWTRPDFAVFDVLPSQVLVIRVQGNYWHGSTTGKDAGQKTQLLSTTIRGLPIGAVVNAWERDIYESPDAVFDAALKGQSMRGD